MLYNGDCLKTFYSIADKSIDLVCVDMHYGTTNCKWDSVIDLELMWQSLSRLCKQGCPVIMFAQTPFDKILGCSNLRHLRYEWVWEKTAATGHLNAKKMPMKAHENILVFYDKLPVYNPQITTGHKPTNSFNKTSESEGDIYGKVSGNSGGGKTTRYPRSVLKFSSDKQKSSLHPTQKPLALIEYLIATYSKEGATVLDFCMGSGTTGVACKNLNRKFIGIEKDKKYFDIAKSRIQGV